MGSEVSSWQLREIVEQEPSEKAGGRKGWDYSFIVSNKRSGMASSFREGLSWKCIVGPLRPTGCETVIPRSDGRWQMADGRWRLAVIIARRGAPDSKDDGKAIPTLLFLAEVIR